jgi:hypothetical protein
MLKSHAIACFNEVIMFWLVNVDAVQLSSLS